MTAGNDERGSSYEKTDIVDIAFLLFFPAAQGISAHGEKLRILTGSGILSAGILTRNGRSTEARMWEKRRPGNPFA